MKRSIFLFIILGAVLSVGFRTHNADLQKERQSDQDKSQAVTATMKSSSRLFKEKDDLTSVILIIPEGSIVTVLGSDSAYLHVTFEENDGYIFRKHAEININDKVSGKPSVPVTESKTPEEKFTDRYSMLENKYGPEMASRIYAHKIWKGMNAEMVKDSWGTAERINRVINNNTIKEEWIYRSTWLYFENNTLIDWGPSHK